jgi:cellulose synthase/poly-beta-1,6-N-acetylglucosamine synthase-like glycosyltransferase
MREGRARRGGRTAADVHVDDWNARRRLGRKQRLILPAVALAMAAALIAWPSAAGAVLQIATYSLVAAVIVMKLAVVILARRPAPVAALSWEALPRYTVIAPMYREAQVCPQLVAHLNALEYPRDRLQVLLTLEADDDVTRATLDAMDLPAGFEVFVAPAGWPKTKPRACNEALKVATGELLVIFDAEDRPEPRQLLEAAARFAAEPSTACFQAPLRIDQTRGFLGEQFAFEYAAQFETLLPALQRLGAPFPLGGSSNHFRTDILRAIGGWDAHNVTEDADLGFRMAAAGLRCGLLATPTWEEPPHRLRDWVPQRSRWVKGHLQTWLVHMRRPAFGGARRFVAIQATLGLGVASAMAHGPLAALLLVDVTLRLTGLREPPLGPEEGALLLASCSASITTMVLGARRAAVPVRWRQALQAPLYWPLHSLAAGRALWQLVRAPFHWDKTEHQPVMAGRQAA